MTSKQKTVIIVEDEPDAAEMFAEIENDKVFG